MTVFVHVQMFDHFFGAPEDADHIINIYSHSEKMFMMWKAFRCSICIDVCRFMRNNRLLCRWNMLYILSGKITYNHSTLSESQASDVSLLLHLTQQQTLFLIQMFSMQIF